MSACSKEFYPLLGNPQYQQWWVVMEENASNGQRDGPLFDEQRTQISRLHISKREFLLWIVSCIIATIWGYTQRGVTWTASEITAVINSMNIVSHAIALGLPIFLGAGIFFARPHSRSYMMDLAAEGHSPFYIILRRFLEVLALMILFAFFLVLTTFIGPSIEDLIFGFNIEIVSFAFFPSALIATCIVMALLLAIGVGIVLAVEDVRYAVPLGCTVTLSLAIISGWNHYMINSWPMRLFVLMSPHNIAKGLAVLLSLLSGYQFAEEYREVMYLGFETAWSSMIIALGLFGILGILSLTIGSQLLNLNRKRWPYLPDMVWEQSIWERTSKSDDIRTKSKYEKQLQTQKIVAAFTVVIILLSFSFGSTTVSSNIETDADQTYYVSPEGGEILYIDKWLIVQFSTYHPNGIGIDVVVDLDVLAFTNFPDTFQTWTMYLEMSQNEFISLGETEQFTLCGLPWNRTVDSFNGLRSSIDISAGNQGVHIFVFSITSLESHYSNATIRYHIEAFQQAGG